MNIIVHLINDLPTSYAIGVLSFFTGIYKIAGTNMRTPRPPVLFLLLVPVTAALYDICYFRNGIETCSVGNFDPPLLQIPPNACSVESCTDPDNCTLCSDCEVVNWVTYAQHQGLLYHSANFLAKPNPGQLGGDAAYDCARRHNGAKSRDPMISLYPSPAFPVRLPVPHLSGHRVR